MREILFKAKRIDNGEWVVGDLSQHKSGKKFIKAGSATQSFEISADTICQYTGLTDKNGNKIWENDVVIGDFGYVKGRYTIRWFGSKAKFDFPTDATICEDEYEVIGNIFDNHKLIGE